MAEGMSIVHTTPPPRQLGTQETLDNLIHWRTTFRTFYKRDDYYKHFVQESTTWDPNHITYNQVAEVVRDANGDPVLDTDTQSPKPIGLGRTAEQMKEDLLDLLDILASYLPHSYLIDRIVSETTGWKDVWDLIYEHYGDETTNETFLDFESINKQIDETHRQFYERLLQHGKQHLAPEGATVKPLTARTADETSITLMNMIALQWLWKTNQDLIDMIKLEYSIELQGNAQLAELVPKIATNIDYLLSRHMTATINNVKATTVEDNAVHDANVNETWSPGPPCQRSGSIDRGRAQTPCGGPARGPTIRDVLSTRPRKAAVVKMLQMEDSEYFGDDDEESVLVGKITQHHTDATDIIQLQTTLKHEQSGLDMIEDIEDKQTSALVSTINNPQNRQSSRQQNGIRRAVPPMVPVHVNGNSSLATIDEGYEINCMDQSFATKNRIAFVPTTCQTQEKVYVTIQGTREPVTWNLGNMVVIRDLGTNILIGGPGKCDNKIITISHSKSIQTISDLGNTIVLPYAPGVVSQIQGHKEPVKLYEDEVIRHCKMDRVTVCQDEVTKQCETDRVEPCKERVTKQFKTNHVELCTDELTTPCIKESKVHEMQYSIADAASNENGNDSRQKHGLSHGKSLPLATHAEAEVYLAIENVFKEETCFNKPCEQCVDDVPEITHLQTPLKPEQSDTIKENNQAFALIPAINSLQIRQSSCKQNGITKAEIGKEVESDTGFEDAEVIPVKEKPIDEGEPKLFAYECDDCGFIAKGKNHVAQHIGIRHGDLKDPRQGYFACNRCDFIAKWKQHLIRHIKTKHEGLDNPRHGDFPCDYSQCDFVAKWKQHLVSHKKTKHVRLENPRQGSFPCDYNKAFTKKTKMKRGETTHSQKYSCQECGKVFAANQELQRHMMGIHTGEGPFKCGSCRKGFITLTKVKKHELLVHEIEVDSVEFINITRFPCTECDRIFTEKRALQVHIVAKHVSERPFKCGLCEKGFLMATRLRKHGIAYDEGVICIHNLPCDECGSFFAAKRDFRRHRMGIHTRERPFKCDECKKRFATITGLKKHKLVYKLSPGKVAHIPNLPCGQCKCQAPNKYVLGKHKKSRHEGANGGFECTICSYTSRTESAIGIHKRGRHAIAIVVQENTFQATRVYDRGRHVVAIAVQGNILPLNMEISEVKERFELDDNVFDSCEQCEYMAKGADSLRGHRRAIHEGVRYFYDQGDFGGTKIGAWHGHKLAQREAMECRCDRCEFKSKYGQRLANHKASKQDGLRFDCDQCEFGAMNQRTVETHMEARHEGAKYESGQCDFVTKWKYDLKYHKDFAHEGNRRLCVKRDKTKLKGREMYKVVEVFLESDEENLQENCDPNIQHNNADNVAVEVSRPQPSSDIIENVHNAIQNEADHELIKEEVSNSQYKRPRRRAVTRNRDNIRKMVSTGIIKVNKINIHKPTTHTWDWITIGDLIDDEDNIMIVRFMVDPGTDSMSRKENSPRTCSPLVNYAPLSPTQPSTDPLQTSDVGSDQEDVDSNQEDYVRDTPRRSLRLRGANTNGPLARFWKEVRGGEKRKEGCATMRGSISVLPRS